MKTVLITGASGYLGSNIIKYFLNHKIKIIILKRKKSNFKRINNYLKNITIFSSEKKMKYYLNNNKLRIDVIHLATKYDRKNFCIFD